MIVGDLRAPFSTEIRVFQDGLAALAEIVVFVALGLTIDLSGLTAGRWVDGLLLAAFAALVARPLALGALLAPARLRRGERLFVIWGGLKGAVPILLAAFALGRHVARRAAHLRDGVRRRARLGDRAGRDDRHRGAPPRRRDARL